MSGGAVKWVVCAVLAAIVAIAPAILSDYGAVLGFGFFIAAGLAISWNLVGGFAGQFALGHSMFVGIGSYSVAVVSVNSGVSVWAAMVLGGVLSALLATLSAALFLRMRGAYFSVATMGLALIMTAIVVVSPSLGATAGIILPGDLPVNDLVLFYVSGGLALAAMVTSLVIRDSPFGLALMAVRDDETAAAESGVNPLIVKCLVMAISGGLAGLFGGLVALQKLTVEPYSAFSMLWTILMIMMSVIGGLGSVAGPIVGAAVVFFIQQALDELPVWNLLITALVLIVIIRLAPGGLVDVAAHVVRRARGVVAQEGRSRVKTTEG